MKETSSTKGWRKIVFSEPGKPAIAITGEVFDEGDFFKVSNDKGEMLIARSAVICIKNPGGRE